MILFKRFLIINTLQKMYYNNNNEGNKYTILTYTINN